LPDEFFLVVELRIKIDKIHSGILGHFFSLIGTAKRNNRAVRFRRQGKKLACRKQAAATKSRSQPARYAKNISRNSLRRSQGKFFRNIVPRISARATPARRQFE